jgi:hypothetical protein
LYTVAGATIDVSVQIEKFNGGADIIAFETLINFDSSAVSAVAVINSGTLSGGWLLAQKNYGNRISIAASGTAGFHSSGTLFKIRFQIKENLPIEYYTPITFGWLRFNEVDPTVITFNGGLRVVDVPSEPSLISPYNGEYDLPNNVQFSWYSPFRAETFNLQIAENNSFTPVLHEYISLVSTTYTVNDIANGLYYWRVRASNVAGYGPWSEIRSFTVGPEVSVKDETSVPKEFALHQNFPNPFNPTTTIKFDIPTSLFSQKGEQRGFVTLKVYDVIGREIATLVNEQKEAGSYEVKFDASKLSSGIYFYRITVSGYTAIKKLVLTK